MSKEAIEALERAREHIHYAPLLQQIDSALSLLRAGQGERNGLIEKSRDALLEWHKRLLPETVKPQSCVVLQRGTVERLVDDLLDAAMSLEERRAAPSLPQEETET